MRINKILILQGQVKVSSKVDDIEQKKTRGIHELKKKLEKGQDKEVKLFSTKLVSTQILITKKMITLIEAKQFSLSCQTPDITLYVINLGMGDFSCKGYLNHPSRKKYLSKEIPPSPPPQKKKIKILLFPLQIEL